jgi:hypothetical protein
VASCFGDCPPRTAMWGLTVSPLASDVCFSGQVATFPPLVTLAVQCGWCSTLWVESLKIMSCHLCEAFAKALAAQHLVTMSWHYGHPLTKLTTRTVVMQGWDSCILQNLTLLW